MSKDDLEEKCLKLIDVKASLALKSEAFTKITLATVARIVERETLNIKEVDLCKACVAWAEAECERKNKEVFCQSTHRKT